MAKKKYNGPSEDRLQQECYMWFWNTYPQLRGLLFAVPNGGYRTPQEAKKFRLTGVVSGVSDMLFMYNAKTYCFELKTEVGYQSTKQLEWQRKAEQQGFNYYIIRDLETFQSYIKNLITNF